MGSSASKTASSSSSCSASNSPPQTKLNSPFPSSTTVSKAFSFPMPLIHHPPVKKGDTHHLVSLTSTTYGSLLLVDGASDAQTLPHISVSGKNKQKTAEPDESRDSLSPDSVIKTLPHVSVFGKNKQKTTEPDESRDSFSPDSVIKTLPHVSVFGKNKQKTAETDESRDSLSPDSVINTWELMNGLDDEFDLESGKHNSAVNLDTFSKPTANHDVSVNGSALKPDESYEFVRIEEDEEDWIPLPSKPKQPLWKHLAEESFLSDLDPNIVSSYKRALSSKLLNRNTKPVPCSHSNQKDQEKPRLLETEANNNNKIVLYFTSLRGIRKTYEDCCFVRSVLRGFQVAVEECDISMESNYRKEVQIALGEEKPVCLPQVFVRGIHIGGIEEIKKLNDGGELGEMFKGFPVCESVGACESCGDARFVMCTNCGGSAKVFEEQEDGFKRCNGCNENGLVRCKKCCL